jgi:hypothetical protein
MIAKSSSIKGAERKSGGCARKAVELTSGDLERVPTVGTEGLARASDRAQKSAEGKVGRRHRPVWKRERGAADRRPERCPQGLEWSGD